MSALPESVRRAAELSNQLAQKAKAGTLTMSDVQMTPDQVQMPVQQAMPKGFVPNPPGDGAPGLGTPGFNPQPAEAPQAQAPVAAAPAPVAPPPDEANEQRFKVLQGKYNAEVPRLHQQLKDMKNQLDTAQQLLANLAVTPAAAHPAQQALVSEQEVKEYGADLIDVVRRVAREEVAPRVRTLEEQFRPVAQAVQQMAPTVQQTAQESQQTAADLAHERICNSLDATIPEWEAINQSTEFQNWLALEDPYAGQQRGAMLAAAYRKQDIPRISLFFTGFMKEHAAVAPAAQGAPAPTGTPQSGIPAVTLASLAAPGTGVGGPVNAGAPNEQPGSRVYTQAEISAFYMDVRKGAYRGRDADRVAIEKDIFNASKTGRVRP